MHCFPDKSQGVPKSYLEGKDGQRNRSYCIHSTLYSRYIFTRQSHNHEAQTVAKKAHDGAGDYRPGEPGTWLKNVKKSHPRIQGGLGSTIVTAEYMFRWKNVHKQDGDLIAKKQDKLCSTRRVSANEQAEVHPTALSNGL